MDNFQLQMQINTLTYMVRNNSNLSPIFNEKILFLMNKLTSEYFKQWRDESTETLIENKVFTKEELKTFNGLEGNPTYVAINGIVYDVSDNPFWVEGHHFGLMAGQELTDDFYKCHKSSTILSSLKKVGKLAP